MIESLFEKQNKSEVLISLQWMQQKIDVQLKFQSSADQVTRKIDSNFTKNVKHTYFKWNISSNIFYLIVCRDIKVEFFA